MKLGMRTENKKRGTKQNQLNQRKNKKRTNINDEKKKEKSRKPGLKAAQ